MQSQSSWGYGGYNQGAQGGSNGSYDDDLPHERGSRRRRLAAMAGSMYRAGVAAASEVKEQYNNTRIRDVDSSAGGQITIPGSFPDVAISVQGDDQMVLFPSYAKRHIRQFDSATGDTKSPAQAGMNDEQYWHQEWARNEDEKAVVDVDVRGWVYSPHKGPMTRKNRMLIGLARRLSGIPPPTTQSQGTEGNETMGYLTTHQLHEEQREQQRIAKEAETIERIGQGEKEVATRGGYSEPPKEDDSEIDGASIYRQPSNRSGVGTPSTLGSAPSSPQLQPAKPGTWNTAADLTEAELAVANANLMARLGPFLTTPLMQQPVTIFFYNDETSQSRTVMTNDSGHFNIRAALDFVPTHVRVLANEDLSAVEPVRIIESKGISVISDIDDTIKKSNISLGAREIFRNTFIRDWADAAVEGVQEWYGTLHEMGAQFHYCSNSPWQLFPVLATFLKGAGIPPGSLHLKQYSGMLQGIFEPVAERKKGTLDRLMRDFPERKFLLVGDSGEADLEVYTELAQANPGRILAIFIRDVTTPPDQPGYFDAAVDPALLRRKAPAVAALSPSYDDSDTPTSRPALPPRIASEPPAPEPVIGDLIDFSDEPEQISPVQIDQSNIKRPSNGQRSETSPLDLLGRRPPPPRPSKPLALRSAPSESGTSSPSPAAKTSDRTAPPPPKPRRKPTGPQAQTSSIPSPLSHTFKSEGSTDIGTSPTNLRPFQPLAKSASSASLAGRAPPPLPRRRGTPTPAGSRSPKVSAARANSGSSDVEFEGLGQSVTGGGAQTPATTQAAVNRKVDLWHRRLARAQGVLHGIGTQLYTWRRGEDVVLEAVGIAREALRKMEK